MNLKLIQNLKIVPNLKHCSFFKMVLNLKCNLFIFQMVLKLEMVPNFDSMTLFLKMVPFFLLLRHCLFFILIFGSILIFFHFLFLSAHISFSVQFIFRFSNLFSSLLFQLYHSLWFNLQIWLRYKFSGSGAYSVHNYFLFLHSQSFILGSPGIFGLLLFLDHSHLWFNLNCHFTINYRSSSFCPHFSVHFHFLFNFFWFTIILVHSH